METEVYRQMGLNDAEYHRIVGLLGREPNYLEVGLFAVMWSEHCSYKNSKRVLGEFPTSGPRVLQGPGENAGVVDIGDGQAVVFKVESHNHPSAIEPFQGAATGVGGIVRDVFTMGARPIALLDSLRFGEPTDPRVSYLLGGVVGGIAFYGNCLGIPTVAGEVYFEDCYAGNPLVNAMCVGLMEHRHLARGAAAGEGNAVMVVGARTGRDGIHGATFASEELSEQSAARRPAVQVGDPFLEKLLLEACLELIRGGYVVGMQDMGAAGLTSSAAEMASRAGTGLDIDVALVPRREEGMTPYEVMLSESQERMLLVPQPGQEEKVAEVLNRWGLNAAVIGRVTGDGMLRVREEGRVVGEVPVQTLTEECPLYTPPEEEPSYLMETRAFNPRELPLPELSWGQVLLELLGSPNLADRSAIYRQYDYQVRINTVIPPGAGDAAVLRIKGTTKGLAVTIDCNGRYCYLDPYTGGALAVAEAARNLVCTGAEPLAVTDCLNFGNPEKPAVYWQFHQAVQGMSAACRALETPVIGGNVSFYNESSGRAIYPTPVVGMVGLIPDVSRRCGLGFKEEGHQVVLLGTLAGELGGSEYLKVIYGKVAGLPPRLDLDREKAVQRVVLQAIRAGLVASAHDVAEGGLAVALAECCLAGGVGVKVNLPAGEGVSPAELLYGEAPSRILLSLTAENLAALEVLAAAAGLSCLRLGRVGGQNLLLADGAGREPWLELPLGQLQQRWKEALPCWI